jgi:diguanylate cyclase (GGDEF)-like protein
VSERIDAPRRVLIVDDTPSLHDDFRRILLEPERGRGLAAAKAALFGATDAPARASTGVRFAVDGASQGQQAVAMAEDARTKHEPYQLAFVDMRMPPGWDGVETIERLWRADPDVQVVVCTAYSDRALDSIGDRFGASDKLLILKKPFEACEVLQLARTLTEKWRAERRAESRVAELESDLHRKVVELEHDLRHDRLTGLPNRLLLSQRLHECMKRRDRDPSRGYAVLFLDCDGFKLINDSFGHEAGDTMLVEISHRLRDALRATDLVSQGGLPSRLGGDEVLVLLVDLRDERDSALVAERLIDAMAQPFEADGRTLSITMSIGIATGDRSYTSPSEIIRDADTAMYRAKAEGGGHYAMFDVGMHAEVKDRLSLIGGLREAVRAEAITLQFQPVIRLADRRLVGFEALARWTHPERGPIAPGTFIPIAEESGLIEALGASVLRKACAQLAAWRAHHAAAAELRVAVNVSRRQLTSPDLPGWIARTLAEHELPPRALILEITEGVLLSDVEGARAAMDALRELGLDLHMDDFGTGYSSLAHLNGFPLSAIKIDRAFLVEAFERPEHREVLAAIVRIGRALGLTLVGEGIETPGQLEMLQELGVDYGQGYLLGRPMDPAAVESTLLAGGTSTQCVPR